MRRETGSHLLNKKRPVRILVVEDHEATRLALAQLLQKRHYEVTTAASCAEALSLMEKHRHFQLLICDIGLPDCAGYTLMVEFQEKFGGKGIALTGYGGEKDITQSQAAGFTTHLTKPVSVELLDNALALALKIKNGKVFVNNGMPRE